MKENGASTPNLGLSIGELAEVLCGTIRHTQQPFDPNHRLFNIKPLSEAGPSDLSFFHASSPRNLQKLRQALEDTKAAAVIVAQPVETLSTVQIVVDNAPQAIIRAAQVIGLRRQLPSGIHPTAQIDATAHIHPSAHIGPFCCVCSNASIGAHTRLESHVVVYDGATIGNNCHVHSHAVVREFVTLGDNCLIQNGAVIGGDGFGYTYVAKSGHQRIPHLGTVSLADNVDVGANSTIDRATFGTTSVGNGTKIDNLVMIGHNVQIGSNALLCGQVGLSGSCNVGHGVVLGGQAGVADHVNIANGVRVAAKSGVSNDLDQPGDYGGYPARQAAEWKKSEAIIRKLPEMWRKMRKLVC